MFSCVFFEKVTFKEAILKKLFLMEQSWKSLFWKDDFKNVFFQGAILKIYFLNEQFSKRRFFKVVILYAPVRLHIKYQFYVFMFNMFFFFYCIYLFRFFFALYDRGPWLACRNAYFCCKQEMPSLQQKSA